MEVAAHNKSLQGWAAAALVACPEGWGMKGHPCLVTLYSTSGTERGTDISKSITGKIPRA